MMDTISYRKGEKGIERVVTHVEIVSDPKEESRVIEAQLSDIVAGGGEVDEVVANYKAALSDLAGLV